MSQVKTVIIVLHESLTGRAYKQSWNSTLNGGALWKSWEGLVRGGQLLR